MHARRYSQLAVLIGVFLVLVTVGLAQQTTVNFGTSGGSIQDSSKLYCCGGTLGSQLTLQNGVSYILSNNHVLARTNQAAIGESIIAPGLIDQAPVCSPDLTDEVGRLAAFVPISFNKNATNKVDAAIARITSTRVAADGSITNIGVPSGTVLDPSMGLKVKKQGRTTGLTKGTVQAVGVTVSVSYQPTCGMGKKMTAKFVDQFTVTPGNFSAGGDSGSLIVEDVSSKPRPVGLLFAGSSTITIGNKMSNVVAGLQGVAPTTVSAPIDQRAKDVAKVKDKYDDYLFSLPEVVGHGVGLSQDHPGELAIVLYVRHMSDDAKRAAPRALENIPVELVATGEIQALPGPIGNCQKTGRR
jgi:hypothetical protein